MIGFAELNTMLLFTVMVIAMIVNIIRIKNPTASFQAPVNAESIVSLLLRNGISPTVKGPWIVFCWHDQEYTVNTSKLPILVVIKQTSLVEFHENSGVFKEVAQSISLDTAMVSVNIDGEPASRAIIQVYSIETCMEAFERRLIIYLNLINETEKRFIDEIVHNNKCRKQVY